MAVTQALLQQFILRQQPPRGAPVFQPPADRQRGMFRLVRSAAGAPFSNSDLQVPCDRVHNPKAASLTSLTNECSSRQQPVNSCPSMQTMAQEACRMLSCCADRACAVPARRGCLYVHMSAGSRLPAGWMP